MSFADLIERIDRQVVSKLSSGEVITYRSGACVDVVISALHDNAYELISPDASTVVSSGPMLFVRVSDLSSDPDCDGNARVVIDGTSYMIRETHRDGQGGAILHLHLV